jgi:ribosomal protein S18 acetylase RimI-like enzyme
MPSATPPASWSVRPVAHGDEPRWRELYAGYAAFYKVEQTEEMAARVWSWLFDPARAVEGIVAVDAAGEVQGLAHFREFARPLRAAVGGYLDDLFVEPALRGSGAADALLDELKRIGAERGWTVIRWITAEDNYRARGKYDRVATRTNWVTYDMPPASGSARRLVSKTGDPIRRAG